MLIGFRRKGLGIRVYGWGFGVAGLGLRHKSLGFGVRGEGFWGSGFRVQG